MRLQLLIPFSFLYFSSFACECFENNTVNEFKKSELVIQGRIIAADTIVKSILFADEEKGVKVGKKKYSTRQEKYLRTTLIVENNFKESTSLSDTIYILSPVIYGECYLDPMTFQFPLDSRFSENLYRYLLYGKRWINETIVESKKAGKTITEIKKDSSLNTFYLERCNRSRRIFDEKELQKLKAIKLYYAKHDLKVEE